MIEIWDRSTCSATCLSHRRLFEDAAKKTGAKVEVTLVPGAWARFKAGDRDGYERLVAEAADAAAKTGATVALAHASMAGAAKLAKTRPQPQPLTSPAVGLRAASLAAKSRHAAD